MRILFIIDPIETLQIKKDTSIVFMERALAKGYEVFFGCAESLTATPTVNMRVSPLAAITRDAPIWYSVAESTTAPLTYFSWVIMRKDPPVDSFFIDTTYLLDLAVSQGARVCNNPTALRNFNEKITAAYFATHAPKMIVSSNIKTLLDFLAQQEKVVVKPLNGMGGEGIFQIREGDANTQAILETVTQHESRFVMMQRLIEKYTEGDKRVLIANNQVMPKALLRVPKAGEARANLAKGGQGLVVDITPKEKEIATHVAHFLHKQGVLFSGLDFIDGYLTEVNITSPTGVKEIEQDSDLDISGKLLEAMACRTTQ